MRMAIAPGFMATQKKTLVTVAGKVGALRGSASIDVQAFASIAVAGKVGTLRGSVAMESFAPVSTSIAGRVGALRGAIAINSTLPQTYFTAQNITPGTTYADPTVGGNWRLLHNGNPGCSVFIAFTTTSSDPNAFLTLLDTNSNGASGFIGTTLAVDDRASVANESLFALIGRGVGGAPAAGNAQVANEMPLAGTVILEYHYQDGDPSRDDCEFWVNGTQIYGENSQNPPSALDPQVTDLTIGELGGGNGFTFVGTIHQVNIYDSKLSASDRAAVYAFFDANY